MQESNDYDAVVVGAGPNGLTAAVRMAEAGCSVLVIEANDTVGGGSRSGEYTLPGFVHDHCSAVHPMAAGSPYLSTLPLDRFGLEWIHPPLPLAHPLDGGDAAVLHRSLDATADSFAAKDGAAYRRLFRPLADGWPALSWEVLGPVLHLPRHPVLLARFGLQALRSGKGLAEGWFEREDARALFGGVAAHSLLAPDAPASAAIGLVLTAAAHAVGWPIPKGGAQKIADALAAYLQSMGGTITTGRRVKTLNDLPSARAILFDVTPRQLLMIAGDRLPAGYRSRLEQYRYGPGVFKIDYALDAPVPWTAAACTRAGTLHLGGTLQEVAASEDAVAQGRHPEYPFLLVSEPTRFDPSRAPEGKHVLWAYCHVPLDSDVDMTPHIEAQLERFAPGFRERVLERSVTGPQRLGAENHNMWGGDINGGSSDLLQIVARPILSPTPYRVPARGLYLCSASTPPGGGVHGMCGYRAAEVALRDLF